jgi:hypothetical protein
MQQSTKGPAFVQRFYTWVNLASLDWVHLHSQMQSFSVRIIFRQPVGWSFRWLLHRPSHFTSMSWWPDLPSFSVNRHRWTIGRCAIQYMSSHVVSTWQLSTTLQSWSASVAVWKLFWTWSFSFTYFNVKEQPCEVWHVIIKHSIYVSILYGFDLVLSPWERKMG